MNHKMLFAAAIGLATCGSWRAVAAKASSSHTASGTGSGVPQRILTDVSSSRIFFNPSADQTVTVSVSVSAAGTLAVAILDRDRFIIRRFPSREVLPGRVAIQWDGKDDDGAVVPDEAYAIQAIIQCAHQSAAYDPSAHFVPQVEAITTSSYSRIDGVLAYRLARPSRVHIEAGQARVDPSSHRANGPVLKIIVDSEPRSGGSVLDNWNGFDESEKTFVPDLPDFAVSILAVALPENAVIAVGNRERPFVDYAMRHRQTTAGRGSESSDAHASHLGLSALEDHGPKVNIASSGHWDAGNQVWMFRGRERVTVTLVGPTAQYFLSQPTVVQVYCDETPLFDVKHPKRQNTFTINAAALPPGRHRLVVNWVSGRGPSCVNAIQVQAMRAKGVA